jgi:putative glutamine amidotransferase
MHTQSPVVGIVCNRWRAEDGINQRIGEPFVAAVRDGAGALPLLVPAIDPPLSPMAVLDVVDGLLFTGAVSNVSPSRYGAKPAKETLIFDEARDATTLPLLGAAIAAGKPVLCICRGFQELNVALGGTLYQEVHKMPGRFDHRERPQADLDIQFGPAHKITICEGGILSRIVAKRSFVVNSLHGQGVDTLSPILFAEAFAPDGQLEAASMPSAKSFVLGLQWHPEWHWSANPLSRAIFSAFSAALAQKE